MAYFNVLCSFLRCVQCRPWHVGRNIRNILTLHQIEQFAPVKRVGRVSFPFGLQSVPSRTINVDTNPIPYLMGNSFSKIYYLYLFLGFIQNFHPNKNRDRFPWLQTQPQTSVFSASSVQTVTGCAKNKGLIGFSAAWRNFWVGKVLFCGVRKLKVKFPMWGLMMVGIKVAFWHLSLLMTWNLLWTYHHSQLSLYRSQIIWWSQISEESSNLQTN